jgi:hypothetical protein
LRYSAERDATPQWRFSSAAHRLRADLFFDNTGDLPLYAGNPKQP